MFRTLTINNNNNNNKCVPIVKQVALVHGVWTKHLQENTFTKQYYSTALELKSFRIYLFYYTFTIHLGGIVILFL